MTPAPHSSLSSHVIDAQDITLSLTTVAGSVDILRGVDVAIPKAASVAIVGPSGSGKSSLMAVLSGLERASSGRIIVDGTDVSELTEDELALFRRGRIGIVLQSFHLIPTMTAFENVAVPLELAGLPDVAVRAGAELEAVGLKHRLHHYPAQLSGGEQQRVAIARALVAHPQILFADEPTGNLDSGTGAAIIDLLFDVQQTRGMTMILVTHDVMLAQRCDVILQMSDGRLASPTGTL